MSVKPLLVEESLIPVIKRALERGLRDMVGGGDIAVSDNEGGISVSSLRPAPPTIDNYLPFRLGRITTNGPDNEDDYEDKRYWVQVLGHIVYPCIPGHVEDNVVIEMLTETNNPGADALEIVTASNLQEQFLDTDTSLHSVEVGTLVILYQVQLDESLTAADPASLPQRSEASANLYMNFFFAPSQPKLIPVLCTVASGSTFGTDSADAAITYDVTSKKIPLKELGLAITPEKAKTEKMTYEVNGVTGGSAIGEESEGIGYLDSGSFTLLIVYGERMKTSTCS